MVKRSFKIISFLLLFSVHYYFQPNQEFQKQNTELNKLLSDIAELEKTLNKKSAEEKQSFEVLEEISRQTLLLNKLINKCQAEEREKRTEIKNLNIRISATEDEIKKIKDSYAKYIVWVYKEGKSSYLKYLIDSESLSQALTRYKYLNLLTSRNEIRIKTLEAKKDTLNLLTNKLKEEVKLKNEVVKMKQSEQARLVKRENEKKDLIAKLKNDKITIGKEIDEKRKAEEKIRNLIASLIEKEKQNKTNSSASVDYGSFTDFNSLKGKMLWPIKGGKIVRKFGENRNEKLNTITLNYGIDISTTKLANVSAVSDGIVSVIDWIPGYGSVLIITHKNNYRTVYGHLTNLRINEGDKVGRGEVIGKVSESLEGNIMHFEIWNERNYQNPEIWMAKKSD